MEKLNHLVVTYLVGICNCRPHTFKTASTAFKYETDVKNSVNPLPDYRPGILVFKAQNCPENESSWLAAAKRLNCSIGNDTSANHYYCLSSAKRDMVVEFCYDRISPRTEPGNCLELGGEGYLNYVNCSAFIVGCPSDSYLSEKIYLYQACLKIDPNKRCFLEDKFCKPTSTTSTTEGATDSNESLHNFTTETPISNINLETVIAVTIGVLMAPLLLGILGLYFCLKRRRQSKRRQQRAEQNSSVPTNSSDSSDSLQSDSTVEKHTVNTMVDSYTKNELTLDESEKKLDSFENEYSINLQQNVNKESEIQDIEIDGEDETFPSDPLIKNDIHSSDLEHSSITVNNDIAVLEAIFGDSVCFNGCVKTKQRILRIDWQKQSLNGTLQFETILIDNLKFLDSSVNPENPRLLLKEIDYADGSTYRAICHFDGGQIASNEVKVLVRGDKPKVKLTCEKMKADINTEIAIYADVSSVPSPSSVTWQYCKEENGTFKDISASEERYRISKDKKHEFVIYQTNVTDSGFYRLRAVNALGERISNPVCLKISEKKSFIKLNDRITPYIAIFGERIRLHGRVKGKYQIVSLELQKYSSDSGKFETFSTDDSRFHINNSPPNVVLDIDSADYNDASSYRLMCRYDCCHIASNAVEVRVRGEKPHPKLKKRKFVACAGENFTIWGDLNSIPLPFQTKWQHCKNEVGNFEDIILPNERYKFEIDKRHIYLHINPTKPTDSGYYRFLAVNVLGKGKSNKVHLDVHENTNSWSNFWNLSFFASSREPNIEIQGNTPACQTGQPNVVRTATINVPSLRIIAHISLAANNTLWISDDLNHFYHINMQGTVLHQVHVEGNGSITGHVVTKRGDLVYANIKDKVIYKKSSCTLSSPFIETGVWKPTCICSSQIEERILLGLTKDNEAKISWYDSTEDENREVKNINGKDLFQLPSGMVESKEGELYVIDAKVRVLVGLNKKCHLKFTYRGQNPSSFYPSGVCINKYDHILVSDYRSNAICILNKNGNFLKLLDFVLDKSALISPRALCTDGKETLFIGHSDRKSEGTKINIYKYLSDEA
ncbi:uncharacterized protein LOC134265423 [Saccostrea cucullata]|uniref:uncharacterized protein LOC134265423 n=1 Tax=Saccostrea cuccullata TaxID=36930 RepID=UPI002ED002B4